MITAVGNREFLPCVLARRAVRIRGSTVFTMVDLAAVRRYNGAAALADRGSRGCSIALTRPRGRSTVVYALLSWRGRVRLTLTFLS